MHVLRLLALGVLLLTLPTATASAQFESVGTLDFQTSTRSAEAQSHFLLGVSILHSFGWKQAIEQFRAAQELDPGFALAYWGETLSYNHPLFGVADLDEANPRAALQRLGATREARAAKAPTDREQGFLEAVEVLWGAEGEYNERRVGYMEAMERLYARYPDDHEVATFYALSMLAGSRALGDQSLRLEVKAGTIALRVFSENPNHPGAPHYAIHSFDDPIHAPLALQAALRYAEIAPAVAHARHMPTHIFIQHGMWNLVSEHNEKAYQAARDLWEPGDSVGDTVHALDWGQYGDLQFGDYEKARVWIDRLEMVARESDGQARAVSTLPLAKARYVVETEEWHVEPITDDSSSSELLATGLSAVRTGDLATARQAEAALARAAGDRGGPAKISQLEVAASIQAAEGHADRAVALMDEAIAIVVTLRPANGAASPVKPPYELYGEILLDLDRPEAAAEKFAAELLRMPNRTRSLLGAARAATRTGDLETARARYDTLVGFWHGESDHPGYVEARQFIGQSQKQQD
jgi:tetratricopeptide (TPR) repeat protein